MGTQKPCHINHNTHNAVAQSLIPKRFTLHKEGRTEGASRNTMPKMPITRSGEKQKSGVPLLPMRGNVLFCYPQMWLTARYPKIRTLTKNALFCLVGFFGAGIAAILFLAVEGHERFLAYRAFFIQADSSGKHMLVLPKTFPV